MTSAGAASAMSMTVFQAAASPWLKGSLGRLPRSGGEKNVSAGGCDVGACR